MTTKNKPADYWDTLREAIGAYGVSTLARDAGVPISALKYFRNRSRGITSDTLAKILPVLKLELRPQE